MLWECSCLQTISPSTCILFWVVCRILLYSSGLPGTWSSCSRLRSIGLAGLWTFVMLMNSNGHMRVLAYMNDFSVAVIKTLWWQATYVVFIWTHGFTGIKVHNGRKEHEQHKKDASAQFQMRASKRKTKLEIRQGCETLNSTLLIYFFQQCCTILNTQF